MQPLDQLPSLDLAAAGVDLSAHHRELLLRAARHVAADFRVVAAYLTGSLARGLGNPSSDLDVVFVVEDGVDGMLPHTLDDLSEGEYVADHEVVSLDGLRSLVDHVSRVALPAENYSVLFSERPVLRHFCRLHSGRAIVGADVLDGVRNARDDDRCRQVLTTYHAADGLKSLRDAWGCAQIGDWDTGLDTSYRALKLGCEAVLCSAGDWYLAEGAKFTPRRFAERPEFGAWHAPVREALFPAGVEDPAGLIERRGWLTGLLTAHAALHGWSGGGPRLPAPPPAAGPGVLRRSPFFGVARFDGDAVLLGGAHSWLVTPATALVWLLADGAGSLDEVAGRFGAATGLDAGAATGFVSRTVPQLVERDLLGG